MRHSGERVAMTTRRLLALAGSVLLLFLGLVGVASPAGAAHVACGQTILVNTVLDANVGPCASGLAIGADNITLDLNGFTVAGNPTPGDGPGITLDGRTGVTVKNGTVTQWDAGVALLGGSANTVGNMRVVDNRGSTSTDFGDGIGMFSSHRNRILNNEVRNNGPYDGVGMITSNFNVIDGNRITDNNQSATNTAGIRMENTGHTASNDNVVTNNLVSNSGIFGIEVFAGGSRNQIRSNQVVFNTLDGITVFAGGNNNVIEGNNVRSNRGQGIFIRDAAGGFPAPAGNQILRNVSFANTSFDLRDGQPTCGTNQWHGNQGGTGTPPCVFNP
jgi:parallel beta-helix repeat protein